MESLKEAKEAMERLKKSKEAMERLKKSYDSNNVLKKGNYIVYKECYYEIMEVKEDGYVLDSGETPTATKEGIRSWDVTDDLLIDFGFKKNHVEQGYFEKKGIRIVKKIWFLEEIKGYNYYVEIIDKEPKEKNLIINYFPFDTVNGLQNILEKHGKEPLNLSQWKERKGDKT